MDSTDNTTRRLRRRRLAALAVGAAGAVVFAVWAATQPPETWTRVRELAERATAWVRELGPGWFFTAFAVLPAVGFPVSPFAFAAGSLFGPVLGLPVVLALAGASMAVSMTISYVLACHVLRPGVTRLLAYLGYTIPVVPEGRRRMFVFLVRVTPGSPYVFQSFLLGLAGIPFRLYLWMSWVIATTNITLMIVFGDALMKGRLKVALLALAGVVLVVVAIKVARRRLAARAAAEAPVTVAEVEAPASGGGGGA